MGGDVERVVSTLDDAAEAARRPGADWESSSETAAAAAISREVRSRQAKVADVAAKAQKQQQAYLQVFQLYQAQIARLSRPSASSRPLCRCRIASRTRTWLFPRLGRTTGRHCLLRACPTTPRLYWGRRVSC